MKSNGAVSTRLVLILFSAAGFIGLLSCGIKAEPLRIGLISGLSGGNADLGEAGRNGAMIAVEEINAAGGVLGRPVELLVRDDGGQRDMAIAAAEDLVSREVEAIVGAFTTTMTEVVMSVAEPAGMLVFSPTASALHLAGIDDHLFRLNSTSKENAEAYAQFMTQRRDYLRITVVVDQLNKSFTDSWMDQFRPAFVDAGGEILAEVPYLSTSDEDIGKIVNQLLESSAVAVLLVANSVDVARIAQQIRKVDDRIPLVPAEWAGTQQLIELGGQAAEGMEVLQIYDRFGTQESFLAFVATYRERFASEPSFSSIISYETVRIIVEAWELKERDESLKDAILANSPYEGLQQTYRIDEWGDSRRNSYFVIVEDGMFRNSP